MRNYRYSSYPAVIICACIIMTSREIFMVFALNTEKLLDNCDLCMYHWNLKILTCYTNFSYMCKIQYTLHHILYACASCASYILHTVTVYYVHTIQHTSYTTTFIFVCHTSYEISKICITQHIGKLSLALTPALAELSLSLH